MSSEEKGECVTLTWEIENFALLPQDDFLDSPFCKVEYKDGSSGNWKLRAHHSYYFNTDYINYVGSGPVVEFILIRPKRNLDYASLDHIKMSLISSCGEVPLKYQFGFLGIGFFIKTNTIYGEKRQSILPDDILTLCCKIRKNTFRTAEFHLYSVLHSVNYLWNIKDLDDKFCYKGTFIDNDNFRLYISLRKKNDKVRRLTSYKKSDKVTHTVLVKEVPWVKNCLSLMGCKLTVEDGRGHVINSICPFPRINWICNIEIVQSTSSIKLQLQAIVALQKCYQDKHTLHFPPQIDRRKNISGSSRTLCNDLLILYRERALSDTTLNTEGRSFPAHRSILAARSPVFRAMFEKDEMSEGRSGVVDIDDLDSLTVDRMLAFLYSDWLEDVQWKEAKSLYYAADKYDILPLKQECARILKAGLSVDNACSALDLADKHSDQELMKCVVDFICERDEVISSIKWDDFEKRNPVLAAKILRKIYVKNKKK